MFPHYVGEFIGAFADECSMVSRSLEKMLLIAIGLTSVVIVGIPVLFHTLNTISAASNFTMANDFADRVHNATGRVDSGTTDSVSIEISVPDYVTITVSNDTMTILYEPTDGSSQEWTREYSHEIVLTAPNDSGSHLLAIDLIGDKIHLEFIALN
ncbi:hypothetical protein EU537_07985 [Candidatus Thorarchaeota archaeon]|nr:MAG: hypothetical protein EU537_07985 [Candidatus Thorarchaeota archaeon]